ncbi:transcriptional regulator [Streptomyces tsukubensis]|uniref:MarR family transcriptional regulator n=1 Tax=Streptomyces tsukubensis TaxID=83656 RepID=A0A1V4A3G7_9ACTN|nr:transcriptional regulator [Streptomyces tsukubensis]OON74869.1 MarR family transcriptional regulator [Streptomyces tsukubensis]QFR94817.1 transcriptional regulator [Streptomyces tsukubensis]
MTGDPASARRPALDEVIQHPTRLTVVAFLSACDEAEFATVRDGCAVSDSVLSKISSALETAGHVHVGKGHVGKRPRTWLSLTEVGQAALAGHVTALRPGAAPVRVCGTRPSTPM